MYETQYPEIGHLLQAHQADLSQRLWHVVDVSCNLEDILPSQLHQLVQNLTDSFFAFLDDPRQVVPEHLGEMLNGARATPTFLMLTNKALREFCLTHLHGEQAIVGLEAAADFFLWLMRTYIQINQGLVARGILVRQEQEKLLRQFSEREITALHHLAQGMNNQQIARALGVSERSVVSYLQQARQKLGAKGRTDMLLKAIELF